jgi:Flp pilus assembly protein CpaB
MRVLRSLTFWLGVIMAVMAFVAFLFIGRIFNPPATAVVILTRDVPRYGVITKDVLAVDAQSIHPQVAQAYVLEGELPDYLGAVAIEPLYAGDPLTKARLVTGAKAAGLGRLALQLDQADLVAMVIPVDQKTCPEAIAPGDYVNVEFGLGQVRQEAATNTGVYGLATPTPAAGTGSIVALTTTKTISVSTYLTATVPWAVGDVELPLAKTVLQQLLVLDVVREPVDNSQYGMSSPGQAGQATQPATVKGQVLGLVVAVPRDAQEMLTFSINHGQVRIALVSPLAVASPGPAPSLGITWADLQAYIRAERLRALGLPDPALATTTPSSRPAVTPIFSPSATPAGRPAPSATPQPR